MHFRFATQQMFDVAFCLHTANLDILMPREAALAPLRLCTWLVVCLLAELIMMSKLQAMYTYVCWRMQLSANAISS